MAARTEGERLAVIEEKVLDIHHRLFGNGQPGELQEMRKDVDSLKSRDKVIAGIGSFLIALLAAGYYLTNIAAKAAEIASKAK